MAASEICTCLAVMCLYRHRKSTNLCSCISNTSYLSIDCFRFCRLTVIFDLGLQTLRAVTDGKIHVELERARLTRQLSQIRESEGKISEAADLLSEVQVRFFIMPMQAACCHVVKWQQCSIIGSCVNCLF